jgi:hypothetical protein
VPGHIVLQTSPRGFIRSDTFVSRPFVSECSGQIVKQRFHFEAIERARDATDRFQHILSAQYSHAERVQRRPSDRFTPGNPNLQHFPLKILGGNIGEGDRQDSCWVGALFEQPRDPPFQCERFSCPRSSDNTNEAFRCRGDAVSW